MKRRSWIALLGALAGVGSAWGVAWTPTAGGTYTFEDTANWSGSVGSWTSQYDLRQTLTGEQTITVSQAHAKLDAFYPGGKGGFAEVFRGAGLGVTSNLRFMGGDVVLENAVRSESGENHVGYLGDVTVTLRNGGALTLAEGRPLRIGTVHSGDASERAGTVKVAAGGTLTLTNGYLDIGIASPGALWVKGGTVDLQGTARVMMGFENSGVESKNGGGSGQDAYLRLSSGALHHGLANLVVGNAAGHYAQFHLDGGTLDFPSNSCQFITGCGTVGGTASDSYLCSDVTLSGMVVRVGYVTSGTGARSSLTVDDGATFACDTLWYGGSVTAAGNAAVVNVNGGSRLQFRSATKEGAGSATLNLDGGTCALTGDPAGQEAVVYPGGATIDLPTQSHALRFNVRRARGWGVASVTLTDPGSGYVVPPQVTLTGGSGSNATALAILKEDRTLDRVVVTCRGEGYKADDVLTATFTATTGSGAAATVTLAENTVPVLAKTSPYTLTLAMPANCPWDGPLALRSGYCNLKTVGALPAVTEIRLAGGLFTSRENGPITNPVNAASSVVICNGQPYVAQSRHPDYRLVAPAAAGATNAQTHAALRAEDGYGRLSAFLASSGAQGGAHLHFNTYERERGLVWFTPGGVLDLTIGATEYVSPSTTSPVLNGFIDNATVSPVERDPATGRVRAATLTTTFGADANVLVPSGSTEHAETAVNSVVFTDAVRQEQLYFTDAGETEIRSGMVLGRKTGIYNTTLCRLAAKTGTLTTRVPGGFVLYESNTCVRGCAAYTDRRFLMAGPFADPTGGDPMPVTLAGPHTSNPASGALIWMLATNNTFSGGLNLNNAGLVAGSDASLGATGCGLHVSGFCTLRSHNAALSVGARPIEIAADSALELNVNSGNMTGQLAADFSGAGDLIIGHPFVTTDEIKSIPSQGSARFTFTGSHTGFTGTYYVASAVVGAENFAAAAPIRFAGNGNVPGVLRMAGSFVRPLGFGAGSVAWRLPSYPGSGSPYNGGGSCRGGWSAVGGDLTVDLGGAGEELKLNADGAPLVLHLQDSAATGALTFRNPVDCAGETFNLSVAAGKVATLTGTIRDTVGNGDVCLHRLGRIDFTEDARVEVATVRATNNQSVYLRGARLSPGGRGAVRKLTLGNSLQ